MGIVVRLYSKEQNEIQRFLKSFYDNKKTIENTLLWEQVFGNPIDSLDLIGTFIDNKENFNINMWVSIDKGFFINVTDFNADKIIRYLYERYPY